MLRVKLDRRDFCRGLGAILGSGGLLGQQGCQKAPGRVDLPGAGAPDQMTLQTFGSGTAEVVEVRWGAAVDARGTVDPAKVKQMVDAGIKRLTGSEAPWGALVGDGRRIAVKVNTITCQAFTHPEVAAAVARGVVTAGSGRSEVIVWDRDTQGLRDRGYTIDETGAQLGFRCLGSDSYSATGSAVKSAVIAGSTIYFSRLLLDSDRLFNIAALKDHSMAGVSLCLKNNFGMIWGAERLHGDVRKGSGCEPGISALAVHPEVKGRSRLAMIDALVGVCEGGPGPADPDHAFRYAGILFGRDPAAVDRRGLEIIEARRRSLGLESLSRRREPNPSPPVHIENAAVLGTSPG